MLGGLIGLALVGVSAAVPEMVRGWTRQGPGKYVKRVGRGSLVIMAWGTGTWQMFFHSYDGESVEGPVRFNPSPEAGARAAERWYARGLDRGTRSWRDYDSRPTPYRKGQEDLRRKWERQDAARRRRTTRYR